MFLQPPAQCLEDLTDLVAQETVEDPEGSPESYKSDVKVSDACRQLVRETEVLGDAPPVEDVREEAGRQAGQSPQPGGLVSSSSASSSSVSVSAVSSQQGDPPGQVGGEGVVRPGNGEIHQRNLSPHFLR